MVDHFNNSDSDGTLMGLTENGSATFLAIGNACLDLFFHVVPNTKAETLTSRLQKAWSYHALTTLKLVCNLRGVRGTGKSDREGFYTAALWLHNHHPKTLAANVSSLAEFGYFKDFPEILYRLLEGADVRRIAKCGRTSKAQKKAQAESKAAIGRIRSRPSVRPKFGLNPYGKEKEKKKKAQAESKAAIGRIRSRPSKRPKFGLNPYGKEKKKNTPITQERAREIRELKRIEMAKKIASIWIPITGFCQLKLRMCKTLATWYSKSCNMMLLKRDSGSSKSSFELI